MPTLSGEGEEEDVYLILPPTTLTLLSLSFLCLLSYGGGGDGHPEKVSYSPRNKVSATLLEDVRISQE